LSKPNMGSSQFEVQSGDETRPLGSVTPRKYSRPRSLTVASRFDESRHRFDDCFDGVYGDETRITRGDVDHETRPLGPLGSVTPRKYSRTTLPHGRVSFRSLLPWRLGDGTRITRGDADSETRRGSRDATVRERAAEENIPE